MFLTITGSAAESPLPRLTQTGSLIVGTMPTRPCVLCGGGALIEERSFSKFLGLPGHSEARVRRCLTCRMLFLDPYPGVAELEQLYSEAYFTGGDIKGLTVPGSELQYADFAKLRLVKFQATVDLLRRFIAPPVRLLDVGAATGEFLDIARTAGYEVAGIEPSRFAAEQARGGFGLEVFAGSLDAFESSTPFDIIHLSHVLEHLPEPHLAVDKLGTILSKRGVVYLEVPFQWNWVEQLHYLWGRRPAFNVFSVHHRAFFRPSTLKTLFARHGFICRHLTLTPPGRYAVATRLERAKWAAWRGLSLLGQGLFIEAVFSRSRSAEDA